MKGAVVGLIGILLAAMFFLLRTDDLPEDSPPDSAGSGQPGVESVKTTPGKGQPGPNRLEREDADPSEEVKSETELPVAPKAKPTRIQRQALNVAISSANSIGIKIDVEANELPRDIWNGIEKALGEYQWAYSELEKRRSPIVDKLVDEKLEHGKFTSLERPTENTDSATQASFKKRLRMARKREEHGEVVSIQGNSKTLKVVRVSPSEDPRLVEFADQERELNRKYVSEALKYLGRYLK